MLLFPYIHMHTHEHKKIVKVHIYVLLPSLLVLLLTIFILNERYSKTNVQAKFLRWKKYFKSIDFIFKNTLKTPLHSKFLNIRWKLYFYLLFLRKPIHFKNSMFNLQISGLKYFTSQTVLTHHKSQSIQNRFKSHVYSCYFFF